MEEERFHVEFQDETGEWCNAHKKRLDGLPLDIAEKALADLREFNPGRKFRMVPADEVPLGFTRKELKMSKPDTPPDLPEEVEKPSKVQPLDSPAPGPAPPPPPPPPPSPRPGF